MDLILVEVLVGVQKRKIKFLFLFLKVAGPARASRRSIWPASNDNPDIQEQNFLFWKLDFHGNVNFASIFWLGIEKHNTVGNDRS
jgi:hypothetical protein